jgi:hypothetical protein
MEKGQKEEGERREEDGDEKAAIICLLSEDTYCSQNGGKKHKKGYWRVIKGEEGRRERGKKIKGGSSVPFSLSILM